MKKTTHGVEGVTLDEQDPEAIAARLQAIQGAPVDAKQAVPALKELVRTIDSTGGVHINHSGHAEPLGDPEWIDLGDAYLQACAALGLPPVLGELEDEADLLRSVAGDGDLPTGEEEG